MPILKSLKARTIVSALLRAGFYIHHQKGSHAHLRHRSKLQLRVTVPFHTNFDIPTFVLKSILRQAEMTSEEFKKFL